MNPSEKIAALLLTQKAVFLRPEDPFTWTSGIKSPVYCDNRLLISSVSSRDIIVKAFCENIQKLNVNLVAGTATAGIPWAAWIAMELKLPLVYVRSSGKDHGRQNAIEGRIVPGTKTVLIEDLISTGKSSLAAAEKLSDAGVVVEAIHSIFNYDFSSTRSIFDTARMKIHSLTTFDVLAKVAYDSNMLDSKALSEVLEWRRNVIMN